MLVRKIQILHHQEKFGRNFAVIGKNSRKILHTGL